MLIEVLIKMLIKCCLRFDGIRQKLHPTLMMRQMHRRVFDDARGLHLTLRRSGVLTGCQCFVRGLHLTLRRSDALTGFRVFAKGLHLTMRQSDALTG